MKNRSILAVILPILAGLAAWELFAGYIYPSIFIPSLTQVLQKGYSLFITGEIFGHIGASMARILAGFALGSLLGAPLGLLMGGFPLARMILDPYVQFFRFVPSIAWLTPAVIWFGIGELSKVMIILYATLFIVAVNTAVGVSNVPPNKILAARTLGAGKWQAFYFVMVPSSIPFILTGMRIAMGNSFTTVVAAEMVAANQGVGYLIFDARLWMATDTIFLAILILGALGLMADFFFRTLTRLYAGRFGAVD